MDFLVKFRKIFGKGPTIVSDLRKVFVYSPACPLHVYSLTTVLLGVGKSNSACSRRVAIETTLYIVFSKNRSCYFLNTFPSQRKQTRDVFIFNRLKKNPY